MKYVRNKLLAVLLSMGLLVLAGCTAPNIDTPTEPTSDPMQTLREQYLQAAGHVSGAENFYATVTSQKNTTTGSFTFSETSVQEFSYLHYGTDYMLADLKETYTVGNHTVSLTEHYDSGVCALVMGEAGFVSQLTCDQYTARFTPLLLVQETLYGSVSAETQGDLRILTFSQATAPESWTGIDSSSVIDITAQAVLDPDGRLAESRYRITYTSGPATIEYSVSAVLNTAFVPTLEAFPDTSGFVSISDPDIPKLLEQGCGYVLHASSISSSFTENIICQAIGRRRTENATLDLLISDGDLKARLQRNAELIDYAQGGAASSLLQIEQFLNNAYAIIKDGNYSTSNAIDSAYMLTYCQDTLVFPILLPKHITGMTVTENGDTWVLNFDTTRALSDILYVNTCKTLNQNNPGFLDDMASSYEVNYTSGSLVLDKHTGLPLEASLRYSGTHTIAGYAYELSYELTQTYDLTSQTAYEAITGQPLTDPNASSGTTETTGPA